MMRRESKATAMVRYIFNECHETFVKECIDRTLASNRRQVFFALTPKPPSHWFYREFLDYQDKLKKRGENPGYNYEHFTILDNLSLSNEQLRTELAKYDQSSIWFQSDAHRREVESMTAMCAIRWP